MTCAPTSGLVVTVLAVLAGGALSLLNIRRKTK